MTAASTADNPLDKPGFCALMFEVGKLLAILAMPQLCSVKLKTNWRVRFYFPRFFDSLVTAMVGRIGAESWTFCGVKSFTRVKKGSGFPRKFVFFDLFLPDILSRRKGDTMCYEAGIVNSRRHARFM